MKKLQKPTKRQVLKFIQYCLIVVAGNAIAAAASAFFIEPNGLVMGGTTGIGILIKNLLSNAGKSANVIKWAGTITVYGANIALFIIGAIFLGKKFAVATAAGTLLYPSFLSLWQFIDEKLGFPFIMREELGGAFNQPLLAVVFGSLFFGLGIGIVVRVGASTGGTDIPPLILHKYFNIPVSVGLWILDLAIVFIQFFANVGVENILYGVLITLASSLLIDQVALVGTKRAQVKIISRKYEEIRRMILDKLNRGVTMLYGKTGFLRDDCYVLLTIVSNRDVVKLRNAVQQIDPEAFFIVGVISEVRGNGFSFDRRALPKPPEWQDEQPSSDAAQSVENSDKKTED